MHLVLLCIVLSLSWTWGTEGQTRTEDSVDGLKLAQEPPGQKGAEISGCTQGPSDTLTFLYELKAFLGGDALPQRASRVSVNLDSPIILGSSDSLGLEAIINSSTPMLMSSNLMKVQHVELSLPAVLLDLLRQRLVEAMDQMTEVVREEEAGHTLIQKLHRLKALSCLTMDGPAKGESQYRAFLLLKAVHTALHSHRVETGQRVKRQAGTSGLCQLHSLDMDLTRFVIHPYSYDIKNCYGLCSFPIRSPIVTNDHAVLLNSAIRTGKDVGRGMCCVPVKYSAVNVADVEDGVGLVFKSRLLEATECGCR